MVECFEIDKSFHPEYNRHNTLFLEVPLFTLDGTRSETTAFMTVIEKERYFVSIFKSLV